MSQIAPRRPGKIVQLGGAVARVAEDDTAYRHRGAPSILNIEAGP